MKMHNINLYGLDDAAWDAFRVQLYTDHQTVTVWARNAVLAYLRNRGALHPADTVIEPGLPSLAEH